MNRKPRTPEELDDFRADMLRQAGRATLDDPQCLQMARFLRAADEAAGVVVHYPEKERPMTLTGKYRYLLSALSETGGSTTGMARIDSGAWVGEDAKTAAAEVRLTLIDLERVGYVSRLDDKKPVCWLRTEAGTLALNNFDRGEQGR